MRLFIGIWLSETMREEVVDYINQAKQACSGFKWTSRENLHFTLKFLGEIPEVKLKELSTALSSAADQNNTFTLTLGTTGCFPQRGAPRIVWIGVSQGRNALIKLAQSVEDCCLQHSLAKADKPFRPHLTIARAKNDLVKVNLAELNGIFTSETVVTGFSLIESRLFSAGPVYQTLENYVLKT